MDYIIKDTVDVPLEQTNFFDDGLYDNNKPAVGVLPYANDAV